jgi:nucleoside-diphosphate-sugar epimerase
MRIFLTGATGYLGTALVRRLAAGQEGEAHELRALVRPTSRTEALRELGVATFPGDVTDPESRRTALREAMSGADWVVHLAAELDPAAPLERMRAVNVGGSEAVAGLAHRLGVGRFLSVSSIAYFGGSPADGAPADEETPPRRPFPSAYSLTKHEGERAIRGWAGRGLRVHTVYPSLIYGPPGKKQGANWLLRGILKRRFPALVGGGKRTSWVFLDDVVDGIVRLMARAAELPAGRDYLLAGDVVTVRELAARVAALGGVRPPRLDLPVGLARVATAATAPFFRLAGKRPPLPADQLRSLGRHWAFDDARARRELGWRPRSLAEGLPPTVEYLQERG